MRKVVLMCKRGLQTAVVCIFTEKIRDIKQKGIPTLLAFWGVVVMSWSFFSWWTSGKIKENENGDVAVDQYHRFKVNFLLETLLQLHFLGIYSWSEASNFFDRWLMLYTSIIYNLWNFHTDDYLLHNSYFLDSSFRRTFGYWKIWTWMHTAFRYLGLVFFQVWRFLLDNLWCFYVQNFDSFLSVWLLIEC